MHSLRQIAFVAFALLVAAGCGKKDDGVANPNPAPVGPTGPAGTFVSGTNCPLLGGGTALSSLPFVGRLTSNQNWGYQWQNQLSTLTLSASIVSQVGYSYQNSNLIASGAISLAELSSYYTNNTVVPTACLASPTGTQTMNSTGYFYNGQVSSLVLTGSLSVPYYSPFSWRGYPTGSPGTNPTLGQEQIQVIVGSSCATSLVPSYGNASGRIRGCISVRMGNQVLNYVSQ